MFRICNRNSFKILRRNSIKLSDVPGNVVNTMIPILGMGGILIAFVKVVNLVRYDWQYGESAVCEILKEIVLESDDLDIKLDSPMVLCSTDTELKLFYRDGKMPTRDFAPPCEKVKGDF